MCLDVGVSKLSTEPMTSRSLQSGSVALLLLALIGLLVGCQNSEVNEIENGTAGSGQQTQQRVEEYFAVYAERENWSKFLSFYSDGIQFKDEQLKIELDGIDAFKEFYNWEDPRFQKVNPNDQALVIHELVVEENRAVARGSFHPFLWDGSLVEFPGEFVIWLVFDDAGRIVSQRDFIHYPESLLSESG